LNNNFRSKTTLYSSSIREQRQH